MIPRLLKQLEQARCEFTWRELCHELLPCATVLRWRARAQARAALGEQPGVKKKQPLALATFKQQLAQLNHARRRTAGPTALHQQFADAISRRRFQELVEQERRNLVEDMKRIDRKST